LSSFAPLLRPLALLAGAAALGCAAARPGAAGSSSAAPPAPAPTPAPVTALAPVGVREHLDLVYGTGGGEELKLDLYAPRELPSPVPGMVVLHGGGWAVGSKNDFRPLARAFAERGYVAVTVAYRLAPQHKFPAQVEDAKCAVRWLRANARRYRVDPERIGVVGVSAGAHLALLLGLTDARDGLEGSGGHPEQSSRVQAVINCMGPTDLTRPGWPAVSDRMIVALVGGTREQLPAVYRAASPLTYVRPGAPPVLTIHGTSDSLVPYEQAMLLHAALGEAGVPSYLETMRDRGHADDWTGEEMLRIAGVILDFADRHLMQRR
jgi:acetyl esterase/lipase